MGRIMDGTIGRMGRLVVALTAALATGMLTGPARGQYGEAAGIAEAMQPEYFRRDVTLFANGLGMDEAQQMIMETLFEDYQTDFDAGVAAMHDQFKEMQAELKDAPQETVMERVFQPFKDWAVERQQLGERYLENIRLLLNAEQQERWPRFEQELLREKVLAKGRFAGEGVNLFHVIRDLHPDRTTEQMIQPVMDSYGEELHMALKHRQSVILHTQRDLLDALASMNTQNGEASMVKQIDARLRVRDVNDKFITLISESLPEPLNATFRRDALERAYPAVYRETPYERLFREALALEGIGADMRPAIQSLFSAYQNELAIINDQLARVKKDYEPLAERERIAAFEARRVDQPFERTADPSKELFEKRQALGVQYLKNLQAVLTEEQFDSLPGAHRWLNAGVRTGSMRNARSGEADSLQGAAQPSAPIKPKSSRGGRPQPAESIGDTPE